jgi:hypothetical protein
MIQIATFPGGVPGVNLGGAASDVLLPPHLNRMKMMLHRMAAVSAAREGIQTSANTYALWARLEDGSVLGLHCAEEIWELIRISIPLSAVSAFNVPTVVQARNNLVWVELPNWLMEMRPLSAPSRTQPKDQPKLLKSPALDLE